MQAQTLKTDVLVIGNGDAAYSAALQSFKSGVKTLLLTQNDGFKLERVQKNKSPELRRLYVNFVINDIENLGNFNEKPKKQLKNKVDSTQLLKLINKISFTEIKRSGNGWDLKLNQDRSIKAKVLIVADNTEKTIEALKINNLAPVQISKLNYSENLYRTTIAGTNKTSGFLSLYNLLIPDQENLIYIPADSFETGPAAGATAAYAAFFDTKTSLANLKRIQGELLSYKHALMRFEDISPIDSNWLAIQKVGITGIIKAELKQGKAFFNPEKEVSYDEIKQPIKDYYYKAQIWFDDHQNVPINLENTISMVCYVGNKSVDATKTELQKKWNKSYKFSSTYDLKKILTRREFAVIINDYLKPFDDVNVDKTGRVIR